MVKSWKQAGWMAWTVAVAAGWSAGAMAAETFPSKPIRIVVGNAVGGVDDIWARRYAQQMSERLQQTVVVDNRPGASGTLAAMEVLKAPKDGYTLLYGGMASLIQFPSAGGTVRYKPKEDFEPVAMATLGYPVLTAGSNSWAKSIQDLVQKAKAAPANADAYSCGTSGQAATSHFACMMVAKAVGAEFKPVPYKGGSLAATDAASGHVDFAVGFYGEISPLTLGKRLTPLVVFSPKRFPLYPDTPTVKEVGLEGLEMVSFSAFFAPKGTPAEVVQRLNTTVIQSFHTPQMERWLSDAGAFYQDMSPAELKAFYFKEIDLWKQRSVEHGIRVEQ